MKKKYNIAIAMVDFFEEGLAKKKKFIGRFYMHKWYHVLVQTTAWDIDHQQQRYRQAPTAHDKPSPRIARANSLF